MKNTMTRSRSSSSSSVRPSQPSVPLTKFQIFEKLPIELRLAIWRLTLPEAGYVYITFVRTRDPDRKITCRSRAPTPVILHACPESRIFGLKFYDKVIVEGLFLRTYARWDLDTIFIDRVFKDSIRHYEMFRGGDSDFNRDCQKLGMWSADFTDLHFQAFFEVNSSEYFPSLKEVFIPSTLMKFGVSVA